MNYCIKLGNCLDILKTLPPGLCRCCVTSPPYWGLRNYQNKKQLGSEKTSEEFITNMVNVFREVKRVLTKDGTLWLNIGDTYDSSTKNLMGVPWRTALALQSDGWILRQDIIWNKTNPMPFSGKDRCTTAHEYVFLFAKNKNYYYDQEALFEKAAYDGRKDTILKGSQKYEDKEFLQKGKEQTFHSQQHERWPNMKDGVRMRNKRSVWRINTAQFKGKHFAVMPYQLAENCVLAGSQQGDWVLDPFVGAATTGVAAIAKKRNFVGTELNEEYLRIGKERLYDLDPIFSQEIENIVESEN